MALYFISGKGGVGKTHLSTSLSYHLSQKDRKVLLVEFSKFAQYTEYFGIEIGFKPQKIDEAFYASSWNGLDCLHEYAAKVLRSERAADLFFQVPLMKKLSRVAPGLKEIAVLGKITSDYRENDFSTDFDDIVFDCPASGHFLSMMRVPESLKNTVGAGPMKRQCESILQSLKAHPDVHFALVEDDGYLSEVELKETKKELEQILGVDKLTVLENKSETFPATPEKTWLISAKALAPCWSKVSWK